MDVDWKDRADALAMAWWATVRTPPQFVQSAVIG